MKKKWFYLIFSGFILLGGSSCTKKITPSLQSVKQKNTYDAAAFDYVYVEALKQKLEGNDGDALKYLEQCVKINPESDASYYEMAQIVIANGDYKNGKRFISKAVAIDDRNIWYLTMLAGLYYQEKDLDSALIYYEKAVKYYPEKENLQLTLGSLYSENKNYEKANAIFEALDKKYGVNESSAVAEIKNYMAAGKYEDALLKAEMLLKKNPDEILYNGLLAEIYQGMGENEKALHVYDDLIGRNPDDPQIQLSLCDFLIRDKSFDELFVLLNTIVLNKKVTREEKISLIARLIDTPEVIKDYSDKLLLSIMVLEANFKNDYIIPLLRPELFIKENDYQGAALRLEEIVKSFPENYYAWEKLLLVYLQMKDYSKLTSRGEECASRFNTSFVAKILYANGAMETGKYTVALDELRKAEILAGNDKDSIVQVLTMRADTYYRMKDYKKAFQTFEEALKYDKNDLTLINNYAYYLAEQNENLKEAEEMAKKVIDTEKNNATFLDTYGWVLYKRGKLKEAAKIFEEIIKKGEIPDATWYEHFGYIMKKMHNCKKAIENWEMALKLDSTKTELIKEINNCKN